MGLYTREKRTGEKKNTEMKENVGSQNMRERETPQK